MNETVQGIVIQSIGGFYYVEAADAVYECRARGIFRKQGLAPVAGDRVRISRQGGEKGTLEEVLERRNVLVRPPVANLDYLVLVASIADPSPSTLILDKMIAIAEKKGIEPLVVINKADLEDTSWLEDIYGTTGLPCFTVSASGGEGVEPLRQRLLGHISAFTGNSGVGKSSLLNAIDPRLTLETGEISKKLGRGRHTTRHVEFFPVAGGLIADTPGFSAFDAEKGGGEPLDKDTLAETFREFRPYLGQCRFVGCAHVKEAGCAVLEAVKAGKISPSRHRSYVRLYDLAKANQSWGKS